MLDRDNVFWTVVMGALTAQLIVLAVVLGYKYWQEWVRYQANRRAAKRYVRKHGPMIGGGGERVMEDVIAAAQPARAAADGPSCSPAVAIPPFVHSTPEEPCPT